jgi:hypothetical protein
MHSVVFLMPIPTRYFHIANHHLGWGDPNSALWFLGLEEATPWEMKDLEAQAAEPIEIKLHTPHDGAFTELKHKGRSIRALTSKIAYPLSRKFAHRDWRQYQLHQLWQPGCGLCQFNFFPLGKVTWSEWPEHFAEWYGYAAADRAEYEAQVAKTRFVRIKEIHAEAKPQAVVCFGADAHRHARTIFELDPDEAEEIAPNAFAYHTRRVILTPFFRYQHFPNHSAQLVGDKLKAWRVSLP